MQTKQTEFVEHKHFVNNDREKFSKSGAYMQYVLLFIYTVVLSIHGLIYRNRIVACR